MLPSSFGLTRLTVWAEMSFEEFEDGPYGGHRGYWNGTILAILNLCQCDASQQVLAPSDLQFGRRCLLNNFKMAAMVGILDI